MGNAMVGKHQSTGEIDKTSIATRKRQLEQLTTLSAKEAEVAAWKEAGLTHAEIGEQIGVQKGTVDSHAHRIREKYSLAHHTQNELANTFDGDTPVTNYKGWVLYYDPNNDFHRDVLLPAARAEAKRNSKRFIDVPVTDSATIGGFFNNKPMDSTPAFVFYEGEPLSVAEGAKDVFDTVDRETADTIAHQLGYYDGESAELNIEQ